MPEEKEVKNGEATPVEEAQETKSLEEELSLEAPKADEDDEETLQAKLTKAEADRDNYKKGMLKYKAATKGQVVEEEEVEDDKEDVKNVATQAATEVIEKTNEKNAINQFRSKYPALKDPKAWNEVVSNYNNKSGKGSVDDIINDLEAGLVLAKHYGGGKVAEKEITLSDLAVVSNAGSNPRHEEGSQVKESTVEMGKSFRHDAEKLQNEDDSLQAEIQIN